MISKIVYSGTLVFSNTKFKYGMFIPIEKYFIHNLILNKCNNIDIILKTEFPTLKELYMIDCNIRFKNTYKMLYDNNIKIYSNILDNNYKNINYLESIKIQKIKNIYELE